MSELPEPPAAEARPSAPCRIVFVCTGNTCRSPMAEAIGKKLLADRLGCSIDELPAKGFTVLSAGLAAGAGLPAAEEAVAIAEAIGVDLSKHQSRLLTPELAAEATHLLGMTRGHVQAIEDMLGVKARLLSPEGDDVEDPIGQPFAVYEQCAYQMAGYILALVETLTTPSGGDDRT
jgi:protein-tyrosine-phosphatase